LAHKKSERQDDMSRSTISTFQLFALIPDEDSAKTYLESRIWKGVPKCPKCKGTERITLRKDGFHMCNACELKFTIRTGTIFERSHVPLHKWLYAMYLLVTARKGISSVQLAKEIGITQKSAWFVLSRLREACGNDSRTLAGIVEVDETFIGGLERNKHKNKKLNEGRGAVGKTAVIGMRERNGNMVAMPISRNDMDTIQDAIKDKVSSGSRVMTDDHRSYIGLSGKAFKHEVVKHSADEYARGDVNTNGIESVWAVMKRGMHGVYHHASKKHLNRYVDEFAFRLNAGKVSRHTLDRLASFVDLVSGCRITHEQLTKGKTWFDAEEAI
jgi:transposase-like protein